MCGTRARLHGDDAAAEFARFVTVGSLPRPLRRQYGLRWDGRRAAAFRAGTTAARTLLPLVPGPIRRAPMTVLTRAA